MTTIAQRKATLEKRLNELVDRLKEIDSELESHHARDWEELALQRESDEVLENMGLSGKAEIAAIRAALRRIEEGEYGYCVSCGEEIAQERLDVVPFAPLCQDCASKAGH